MSPKIVSRVREQRRIDNAMADKSLPPENIPAAPTGAASRDLTERRAFLRKAALIGVPVVLASIPSRTTWAQPRRPAGGGQGGLRKPGGAEPTAETTSGCELSTHASGCANRTQSLF